MPRPKTPPMPCGWCGELSPLQHLAKHAKICPRRPRTLETGRPSCELCPRPAKILSSGRKRVYASVCSLHYGAPCHRCGRFLDWGMVHYHFRKCRPSNIDGVWIAAAQNLQWALLRLRAAQLRGFVDNLSDLQGMVDESRRNLDELTH